MWRRLIYSQLKTLILLAFPPNSVSASCRLFPTYSHFAAQSHISASPSASLSACRFSSGSDPAVIKSYYGKRIVGCTGGEVDEHDVVWFWSEKDKSHERPVCSQHFVLEMVGPRGSPDGHGDDDHIHRLQISMCLE